MVKRTQKDTLLTQVKALNAKLQKRMSYKFIFTQGVVQGIGFFIGSAILATIALGFLWPWFGEVEWIRDSLEKSAEFK